VQPTADNAGEKCPASTAFQTRSTPAVDLCKGLRADANPVPPWESRKSEKERRAAKKGVGLGR
jgi:hypothetical protein